MWEDVFRQGGEHVVRLAGAGGHVFEPELYFGPQEPGYGIGGAEGGELDVSADGGGGDRDGGRVEWSVVVSFSVGRHGEMFSRSAF